ncbi:MAG: tetratricopeptide repeat protein [Nitrospirae bacterium]|nr:tetratricopeptide repeat protein [Nitrospirota bacterium]
MLLTPFKSLIREKCGLSFEDSREVLLAEGIRARLLERAVASHDAYLNLLSCEPDEFNRLVNLITVKETYFFREPVHFKILTETLIPELLSTMQNRRIRIVCAGCSTGEEPYSIAIALARTFGPDFSSMFSVVGFDIDEEALGRARAGIYPDHSFRGVPDHIQKEFFDEKANGFQINNTVRKGVEFLRLNIFSDPYPDTIRNADVIFYRNVSIYFEPEDQQHIFRNLAAMLNEKGYLFLGSAETFVHNSGVLSLVEKEGIFLYEKGVEMQIGERRKTSCSSNRSAAPATQGLAGAAIAKTKCAAARTRDRAHQIFDRALALAEEKKYEDALQLTDQIIGLQGSFIKARMLRAGILINLQRLDEAEMVCRSSMELDQWSLEGHLLLGLIAKIRGDFEEAKKRFNQAVYIKPSCWLAHFYLGEICRSEGDRQPACREFEIVIKLLEGKGFSEHGLTFFSLSFPMEQVVHLCRHNLAEMKRGKA